MAGFYKSYMKQSGGQGMPDFDTVETDTGQKWTDGKTIYSLAISLNTPITIKNDTTSYINDVATNIDRIIRGMAFMNGNGTASISAFKSSNRLAIRGNYSHYIDIDRIIIFYTKL